MQTLRNAKAPRTSGSYHDRQLYLWLKSHQADALTERKSVYEGDLQPLGHWGQTSLTN